MSETKNIVIKVKYPSPGKVAEPHVSAPTVVTEWNVKRIVMTLGGVLLAMMAWSYFSGGDKADVVPGQVAMPQQEQAPITIHDQTEKLVGNSNARQSVQAKAPAGDGKSVARSQLTSDIEQNEPVDSLKLPLKIGKKDNLWIYYFIELKGLTGQTVYHEWWLNGNLVSRKKVNVSDDPWRTASKQLITYTTNNDWIVRLVDESRNTLAEKSFNLELK